MSLARLLWEKADLTAFSIDLITTDVANIPKAHAVLTIVDGGVIFLQEKAKP